MEENEVVEVDKGGDANFVGEGGRVCHVKGCDACGKGGIFRGAKDASGERRCDSPCREGGRTFLHRRQEEGEARVHTLWERVAIPPIIIPLSIHSYIQHSHVCTLTTHHSPTNPNTNTNRVSCDKRVFDFIMCSAD